MDISKIIFPLLILAVIEISCSNTSDSPMTEPVGSAHYLINNQTNQKLRIVFTTSPSLGSKIDSNTVGKDSTKKILEDGIIGVNPKPSSSFSTIKFYKASNRETPAFVLSPVKDDRWKVISKKRGKSGYGLTKYELTINNKDLRP